MDNKLQIQEALINKWSPYLEGVDSKWQRNTIACCMENVNNYLSKVQEAGDEPVGKFARYAVPLARRILHDIALGELVSVQPLTQPDGKVFYLDFKYGDVFTASTPNLATTDNVADKLNNSYTLTGMDSKGATARKVTTSFTSTSVSAVPRKIVGNIYVTI